MNARLRVLAPLAFSALICATNGRTVAADPSPTPAELLKEYKALGLPLYPKTAKLVRFEGFLGEDDKVDPQLYALAFESKPATKAEPLMLFWYLEEVPLDRSRPVREVKPELAAVKAPGLSLSEKATLILAIQCEA